MEPQKRREPIYGWTGGDTYRLGSIFNWSIFINFEPDDINQVNQENSAAIRKEGIEAAFAYIDIQIKTCLQHLKSECGFQIGNFYWSTNSSNFHKLQPIEMPLDYMKKFAKIFQDFCRSDPFPKEQILINFLDKCKCSLVIQRFGQNLPIENARFLPYLNETMVFQEDVLETVEFSKATNIYVKSEDANDRESYSLLLKRGNSNRFHTESKEYRRFFSQFANIQSNSPPNRYYESDEGLCAAKYLRNDVNVTVLSFQIYDGSKPILRPSKEVRLRLIFN